MGGSQRPLRLVLVEDADGYAALVSTLLAAEPVVHEVVRFARLDAALRHLARADVDCLLLDLELPDAAGTEGIESVLAVCPELPIVVLTGHSDTALPVQVIRAGAQDLVVKGSETGGALMRAVGHAVERRRTPERQQDGSRLLAGEIDSCVNRLAAKAGGWRHVEWTARAVPEDHRVYAVARDVTDRNALVEALAAGDTRYRTLVQNIPNSCVMTFDHNLRFTFAAGDILAVAGLDGSFVGRTLAEAMPEAAAELTPRYRAALGGHPQSFEFSLETGKLYRLQIAPLRDGDGAIAGGMLFAQEVTALKHAQRDLEHAEERFRTAFEQAPIGMG